MGENGFQSCWLLQILFHECPKPPNFQTSVAIQKQIKVFGWLLLQDRLNTRNMRKRRHYNNGEVVDCRLCGQNVEERVDHMIFTCDFSRTCWTKLGIHWPPFDSRLAAIRLNRDSWPGPFFMEVFLAAAWSLWKERNNKHFRGVDPTIGSWLSRFKNDLGQLQHRIKEAHRGSFVNLCTALGWFFLTLSYLTPPVESW